MMFSSPTVRGRGRIVFKRRLVFAAVASLGCLIAALWRPSPAHAATYTWDADGNDANNAQDGSGTWSTTSPNWFLNNATADIGWTNNATDIAAFGVSGGTGGTITLGGSFSAGGIQFTANDAGSFNFVGTQTLNLGSSGILVGSGAASDTFGSGVSISLGASQSWTNNSANPLLINGVVSGGSSALLTMNGTGMVVLSGANTFSGGLTATSGAIKATTSASALGVGSLALGGAALVLANDSGLNFGNATTVSASTTITSDRLTPGAGVTHSLGSLIINTSTLSVAAGSNVTSGAAGLTFGNVAFTGSPTFSIGSGATLQLGATSFGSNTYTKSGAGTLVLTAGASNLAANTTNYLLLISGGTIQANANDVADQVATPKQPILAINPTSGTASFNAQTFNQSFFDLVVGGAYNFGTSTGTAGTAGTTSNIAGTGTFTLTSTTAQIVFNGGLSTATGPVGSTIGPNVAGATTFNIGHVTGNAADATFSGAINNTAGTNTLGWTKTGAGIMVVSGNSSTNTGTININQGTLSLQNANAIGSTAILTITPGAAASAFLDLGTGNTSFARPTGTSAGQITVGNNTATAIDGFQTSSVTGASLNLNNGGTAPVWSQSGFQPGTLQLGTTSSLGPLKFVGGIQLLGANRPIQVDRGNFRLGPGNANLASANNYFDAQVQGSLTSGTVAKSGTGVLSIAGTSTDTNANSYTVNNGVLLLSNGTTGNAIGTDAVSVSTPAANTITAFGGNGSTGGTVTFATSGTTNQSHLAPGNLILTNSNGAVSAISGSIGTLTTADLTLAAGNNLDFVLGKPGKGSSTNAGLGSLMSVTSMTTSTTNNLTLPTGIGSLILNLADNANANNQGSIGTGVYKLIAYNGTSGTLTNFTAGNGISNGTFKIGLTPLPVYSTYAITRTAASNGEIDLAIRAGGSLGVIATDTASSGAYSGGWAAGSNGGSGYGAWASSSSAVNAGTFASTAPEIDTSGSKSLGLFANSGSIADFSRAITGNLQIGHTLAFDFDNKNVQSGGSDGITLKAGGTVAFELFFNGGNADYSVTDSTGQHQLTSPALPFTSTGLHVEFTLTSPTTYTLVATPALGGTASTYTGTLANAVNAASNPISTFRVFNFNAGSGAASNFYINTTNILLPTWNGQSVGATGGNFSSAGNWAAHAPVNGGSIAFDGTGSTVTDDSATSGITSLTDILFNGTNTGAGGPNATATTNAGIFTLQSTGLAAGGLSLGGGITNNSTNNQNVNFAVAASTVGITLTAAQTFNGGSGGLSFGSSTGVNLNGFALSIAGTGSGSNAVTFGGVLSGSATSSALNKTQSGTLILNGAATYAGATTIGVAPNSSGGTIQLGVTNGLPASTTLSFYDNGISRSTLDLHGFSQTVAGLNDGGNNSGLITNSGSGTPTFTLNNTLANFYYGQITGSLAFVKSGAGDEEIGGANTFTGGATVKGGSITVTVSNAGTTSGALGPSASGVTLGDTSGSLNAAIYLGRAGGNGPGSAGGLMLTNNISIQDGSSGQLTLGGHNTSGVNTFSGNITLGSIKTLSLTADPGGEVDFTGSFSGASNLLKQGAGTLSLGGSSTFGPTAAGSTNLFIDQGTVVLGDSNAAGSTANTGRIAMGSSVATNENSALTISAAGINIANPIDVRHFTGINGSKSIGGSNASGTATYSGSITLHDNVTFSGNGGTVSFSGAITTGAAGSPYANEDVFAGVPVGGFNPGPAIMTGGAGTIELTGANTFNGEIVVNNGITLQARGGGTFGSGANNAVRMYGTSAVNIADATMIGATINPHGAPGSDTETIGGTNAAATTATYSGSIFLDDNATLSSANAGANLAFTGSTFDIKNHVLAAVGAGDITISAPITNSVAGGSLVKTGAGTLTLSAAAGNTFSGGVAIGGGTVRVSNASGSATGAGAVNVNSSGTLAGIGLITGPVNINAGGTLAPGNSPGSIGLGATAYNDGGAYRWEINNWTGTNRGTDFDFQNTTGTLAIGAMPGTFPTNTFKIDVTGLNGSLPGNIANFDPFHTRSWTIAEASAGITGFAANKFTIDTSHVVDNLAGGAFSLATANGTGSIQDLVLTFTPGASQPPVIGQIAAIPASGSIITGGSLPFPITVQNSASAGSQDLNFSAAAGANVSGSIAGPVNVSAGSTSAPQAGLSFTGTAIGPNRMGQFTVTDANASNNPQSGTITVNVVDHATPSNDTGAAGSFAGGTLDLGNIHQGYSSPVTSGGSLAVFNGSLGDYRVALAGSGAQTGGPTEGLSLNNVGSGGTIVPGSSAAISATLAPGLSAGAINQIFTYTFRDDSALSGASANVGTATITVTGNVYSGQSIWRGRQAFTGAQPMASTNGTWGNFANWSGGSPGLDSNFITTDSATFGAQSGNVTVDLAGVTPHVNSLVFNQTGNYTIVDTTGTGSISLAGAAPSITGAGTHTIAVPLSLGAGTHITVTAGTLRLNIPKSGGAVGAGVTATIAQGAMLELVGDVSALADGPNPVHRAAVANDGTLAIGNPTVVLSSDQQVGGIDGGGTTIVTAAANLTADHINQLSLVIGDNSTVTIAASDASGNPLSSISQSSIADAAFASTSFAANSPASSLADFDGQSASGLSNPRFDADGSTGPASSRLAASNLAVPEPSAWLLALFAGAGLAISVLRRREARAAS